MDVFDQVFGWFLDTTNWAGASGIPTRLVEHLYVSGAAVLLGSVIAIPLGLMVGHSGRGAFLVVSVANLGRAIPSYALLLVVFPLFGLGFASAFPVLLLLAVPPMLIYSYVGVHEVERDMVEAGRAMGMRPWQVLARVELPIALPSIAAGVKVAAVQVIATATLAALVAGGGLGRYIVDGFALRDTGQLVAGGVLVALLAIAVERLLSGLERWLTSPGLRTSGASPMAP